MYNARFTAIHSGSFEIKTFNGTEERLQHVWSWKTGKNFFLLLLFFSKMELFLFKLLRKMTTSESFTVVRKTPAPAKSLPFKVYFVNGIIMEYV